MTASTFIETVLLQEEVGWPAREVGPGEPVIPLPNDMAAMTALATDEDGTSATVFWAGCRGVGVRCGWRRAGDFARGAEVLARDPSGGPIFWRARVL